MKKYLLILLLVSSFGNAQYNLFARQNFAKSASAPTYNTYIGGVSATISTASALATKLGISVGAISNFTIVGSDIKCKITGSYSNLNGFAFNQTPCTYYRDTDYLVTSVFGSCFYYTNITGTIDFQNATSVSNGFEATPLLTEILLKNATSVGNSGFAQSTNGTRTLKTCYIPNCTSLGTTSGDNSVFTGNCVGLKVYAHPSLATNNAGAPDGDLAYVTANGGSVVYVANFTAPNPITDLSAGTIYNTAIQLNFTPPSSTNTIEYYECYADGVFKNIIAGSGEYIGGLTANTNYDNAIKIIAVDIFLNKSVVSNSFNVSTNTTPIIDDSKVIAAYDLSANGSDLKNGYNGTVGASVTFTSGVANFNNTTNSNISVPDNSDFSFTNGSGTDNAFSISCFLKLNNQTDQWLVNKRGNTSGTDEWQFVYYLGKLQIWLFSSNNANYLLCQMTTSLNSSTQYHITATYSGSETAAGLKLYVNGVLQTTTNTLTGTYTGMPNGTSNVIMGKAAWFDGLRLNGYLSKLYFFNSELTATEVMLLKDSTYPF